MDEREVLVSVDGEFTGPIPGIYSMISFGAVAYNFDGEEISRFKINLSELPGSSRYPKTMEWWGRNSEAWEMATKDPIEAGEGIRRFAEWLKTLPGKPTLIGWPLTADFLFIYWYFVRFTGEEPPFGYDGIDIKTFAMTKLGKTSLLDISRAIARDVLGIPDSEFSHDPLDDAAQQADIYFGLRKLRTAR